MRLLRLAIPLLLLAHISDAAFAQNPAPQITTVSPTAARAGDQIVINGSNFGSTQGSGNVWLGSTYGVVLVGAIRKLSRRSPFREFSGDLF